MEAIMFFRQLGGLGGATGRNCHTTSEVSPRLGVGATPTTRTLQSTFFPTMDADGNIDLLLADSDDELVEDVQDLLIQHALETFQLERSAPRLSWFKTRKWIGRRM